jgi:ribosomal protein L29
MKEDYRKLDNAELSKMIQQKMQELIDLRNEVARRSGERIPIANYDFTKRVTD